MRFSKAIVGAGLLTGTSAQLHSLAVAAGKLYFGSATDNGEITDTAYRAILDNADEFGQITPGNGQKWQFTEPTQGQFSYTSGDAIASLAKENNQLLRCHTLVWHSQLPSWVSGGSWTEAELTSIIETHISNVVGHYKGACYSWDVVNEALNEDGTLRDSIFSQVLGSSFIGIAFYAAGQADPNALLYYNDYNLEWTGSKSKAVINTVIPAIKAAGAEIDGVGCQAHLIVGSVPSRADMAATLQSYIDAGAAEVSYTELDIRFSSLPPTDDGLKTQGDAYADVVGACLDVEECVGITIWDYTDKYSWIPSVFPGSGAALLYDENLEKKPAWTSVSSILAAAATPAC
ncbi:unnamed protein product [Clonostachys solani]|uniref:Beta-xylanase n=1 Tax=Clonostachys solani TaxID=160281 RepID=A0A9N9Z8N8_9HYPO|nr:unnamed protein product [Clonostachys solani]